MYPYSEQGQGSIRSKTVRHGLVVVPFGLLLANRWAALVHLQRVRTSLDYLGQVAASTVLLLSNVLNAVYHVGTS
jgi:hypothetical protein